LTVIQDDTQEILAEFFQRVEVCRKYGISMLEVMQGTPIPPGWVLDEAMDYFMPPTLLES
jgi:hypothetical protein